MDVVIFKKTKLHKPVQKHLLKSTDILSQLLNLQEKNTPCSLADDFNA